MQPYSLQMGDVPSAIQELEEALNCEVEDLNAHLQVCFRRVCRMRGEIMKAMHVAAHAHVQEALVE